MIARESLRADFGGINGTRRTTTGVSVGRPAASTAISTRAFARLAKFLHALRRRRHLMPRNRLILTTAAVCALTLNLAACRRGQDKAPELQTTTGLQAREQPTTVSGCLRRGVAENTFVLTESRAAGGSETATYQLMGRETPTLQQYVGQNVEVSGTLRAEQE